MIGWALRQIVVWGIGVLLFAVVIGNRLIGPTSAPSAVTAVSAPQPAAPLPQAREAAPNSLVFHAKGDGHVYIDAVVNGSPVRFVVDTGATMVVLTARDAAGAGLGRGSLDFSMRTSTANGVGRAAPVRLRELRIGQFSVSDVPAAVVENLGVSLLGQSFLTRLVSYEMRDGVLTLNWN